MKTSCIVHCCLCGALVLLLGAASACAQGLIINHECTDLPQVPEQYITTAKQDLKVNYAHTSHGEQITFGLDLIEAASDGFNIEIGAQVLPDVAGALCIFDGVIGDDYVEPDDYFGGVQSVLDNNPSINVSMFCWCEQMNWESEAYVQQYLDNMNQLEQANPGVTFVYMTGNAQATGEEGNNRYARNNQIRSYCQANGKTLYDFADLDCWYNGQQYTEGGIPVQDPHYSNPDGPGHTTEESCENKGHAAWYLFACLAGWEEGGGTWPEPGPAPGPSTYPISLSADKQFFSASYDTITIFADVQATSNFTPYIRIVTPSGGNLYITSGGGLVGSQEPYMGGPLTLASPITGYMAATFEFSNATTGTYQLQGALVGDSGIIGDIYSTDLIVE